MSYQITIKADPNHPVDNAVWFAILLGVNQWLDDFQQVTGEGTGIGAYLESLEDASVKTR